MSVTEKYFNYIFKDLADHRVYDWPLMSDPLGITYFIVVYLFAIYKWLPNFMEKRRAYDLKRVIQVYNILQIVYCSYLVWKIATSGWTTHFKWGCQEIDYSTSPMAMKMATAFWYYFLLKIVDLVETFFFILRKKDNQVSGLHVYHHVSMVYTSWIGTKYCAGGMASFYPLINSCIHVMMYTYYFLATFGPTMQKKMSKFKSKLTMLQMIQFTIILIHVTTALPSSCHTPKALTLIFVPNIVIIFYMFYKFYIDTYCQRKID